MVAALYKMVAAQTLNYWHQTATMRIAKSLQAIGVLCLTVVASMTRSVKQGAQIGKLVIQ